VTPAQIRAVMFRSNLLRLRFKPPTASTSSRAARSKSTRPRRGQIVCQHLEPRGLGALQLAFEQLKRRLEAEGLFAAARKRALPLLPRNDRHRDLARGRRGARHRARRQQPARRAAAADSPLPCAGRRRLHEVARAIRDVSRHPGVDVVIVARGGGSLEDLWAFNEEAVARAIAASPVPVVSGVGHEIDTTIADFVADRARRHAVQRRRDRRRPPRRAGAAHRAPRSAGAGRRPAAGGRRRAAVHALGTRRGLLTIQTRVSNRERRLVELSARLRRILARRHQSRGSRWLPWPSGSRARRSAAPAGALARQAGRCGRTTRAGHARPSPPRGAGVRLAGRPARRAQPAGRARPGLRRVLRGRRDGPSCATPDTTRDGDTVHVRLEHGRLACTVTGREAEETDAPGASRWRWLTRCPISKPR
jgi:exodeoxyribonuclease VII large subunit